MNSTKYNPVLLLDLYCKCLQILLFFLNSVFLRIVVVVLSTNSVLPYITIFHLSMQYQYSMVEYDVWQNIRRVNRLNSETLLDKQVFQLSKKKPRLWQCQQKQVSGVCVSGLSQRWCRLITPGCLSLQICVERDGGSISRAWRPVTQCASTR